jgi:DNA polymerase III sliding clamp (beta) subunit (PCNA family)
MRVVFETAAFADSIKKAAIVAPGHGQAFDKANGIVLNLDPSAANGWQVLIRSTNLDVYRMEWLDPEEIDGLAPSTWRLPSKAFSSLISSLPIGSGKTVTLEEGVNGLQRFVRVTSGRMKARFNLIQYEGYPGWSVFDPSKLSQAMDLGARISQVEWAADSSGQPPLAGVHFDGTHAVATDKYRLVCAPVEIPGLTEPITVPSGLLAQLLRQTGEIKVGVDGGQLLLMPDESIQIRCVLFGTEYVATRKIRENEYEHTVKVKKASILDMLQRAQSYGASDRDAAMRVFIGEEEVCVMMANQEIGVISDALEVPGQANHERFEILFTPKNLIEPISNSPSEEVIIGYTPGSPNRIVRFDGGSGYLAFAMPRKTTKAEQST